MLKELIGLFDLHYNLTYKDVRIALAFQSKVKSELVKL